MKKQPALITRFKAATAEVETLKARVDDLEKKLKNSEDTKSSYYKQLNDAQGEIEQINQMLDAVPNSIPRHSNEEESWNRKTRSALTRLCAWIAAKQTN